MDFINEKKVLDFYLEEMNKDNITFLKNKDHYKNDLKLYINKLIEEEYMHNKIAIAKDLWKLLFEASMSYIDNDKSGYDKLFNYFDEFVEFEELIFASDSFYRDHTLHCLWVYFLGEYIFRHHEFNKLVNKYNDSIKKQIDTFVRLNECLDNRLDIDKIIAFNIDKYEDSIRCISALTHDLGYPLKKIVKINKSIKKILPYYSINNYNEFNYSFNTTQNFYNEEFINFISCRLGGHSNNDIELEKMELVKKLESYLTLTKDGNLVDIEVEAITNLPSIEKDIFAYILSSEDFLDFNTSNKLRYTRDFENNEHGIMSAFLLVKLLNAFSNLNIINRNNHKIMIDNKTKDQIIAKHNILVSITDHTSVGFKINGLISTNSFLTFIDEIEEFSRLSRANQNRQYINEFCKTNIYMENGIFNVDFIFDNTKIDNLDPEVAFKGRCKKLLSLLDIKNLDTNLNLRLRCIGKLEYDNNIYEINVARKYVSIKINGEEQCIPKYLKSREYLSTEEYMNN